MVPSTYKSKEDGDYKLWNNGAVDSATLARWHPDKDSIFVNGVMVYGFAFKQDDGSVRLWNCKFGWDRKGML